jgi:uncharacterized protein (TIGR02145 family)
MKKTLLYFLVMLNFTFLTIHAQVPEQMSYQAIVRNAEGEPVTNTQIGIEINIYQGAATGTLVYTEIQTPTTNTNGLFTIYIGGQAGFDTIKWANSSYFLETKIDPAGGTDYTVTGTSQLLSVPYAFHSKTAEGISNLSDPVNPNDIATKAYVDLLETKFTILNNTMDAGGKITDIDGNTYNVVKIGDQIWMAENLRVTHYPNGDPIPHVTDSAAWVNLTDSDTADAYCWFDNDEQYAAVHGALYTYSAAIGDNWTKDNNINQGVCPDGWHLPSFNEFMILVDLLGGEDVAGGKLKEKGILHWEEPNEGATNESGFTATPTGRRNYDNATFTGLNTTAYFWIRTIAYRFYLRYNSAKSSIYRLNRSYGFAVRCVKD